MTQFPPHLADAAKDQYLRCLHAFPSSQTLSRIEQPRNRAARGEHYCSCGSPSGKNAVPAIGSPEASTSRNRSALAPLRVAADSSTTNAAAGEVSAGNRKIHGTFVDVKALSPLSASTGTKLFSASCSARWLASRSSATIASACSSINA